MALCQCRQVVKEQWHLVCLLTFCRINEFNIPLGILNFNTFYFIFGYNLAITMIIKVIYFYMQGKKNIFERRIA
ncbi:hypothetical protein [Candidatus Regiella insecticola]|uniref:hypothetical protein n=1 Tax=Candidatus Regiella insecticola TaxID=138073 RepID=UPI0002E950DE|nr:hypothetical protein [Candidatus Regiella insecticola]